MDVEDGKVCGEGVRDEEGRKRRKRKDEELYMIHCILKEVRCKRSGSSRRGKSRKID